MRVSLLSLLLLAACGSSAPKTAPAPAASSTKAPPPVALSFVADASRISPGQELTLLAVIDIQPGWHIFWIEASAEETPTTVRFALPEGFRAADTLAQGPSLDDTSEKPVYRERAYLSHTVVVPDTVPAGPHRFSLEASWLACRGQECVAGSTVEDLHLGTAAPDAPSAPTHVQLFDGAAESLPKPLASLSSARHTIRRDATESVVVIYVDAATELEFIPFSSSTRLIGQANIPAAGVGAIHLSLDPAAKQTRVHGLLRIAFGESSSYFSVDLGGDK